VTGFAAVWNGILNVRTVTTSETLLSTDQVVLCNPTTNITLQLPPATSSTNQLIIIKRLSTNANTNCNVLGIWATDASGGSQG
jgi:hypothetical protein